MPSFLDEIDAPAQQDSPPPPPLSAPPPGGGVAPAPPPPLEPPPPMAPPPTGAVPSTIHTHPAGVAPASVPSVPTLVALFEATPAPAPASAAVHEEVGQQTLDRSTALSAEQETGPATSGQPPEPSSPPLAAIDSHALLAALRSDRSAALSVGQVTDLAATGSTDPYPPPAYQQRQARLPPRTTPVSSATFATARISRVDAASLDTPRGAPTASA